MTRDPRPDLGIDLRIFQYRNRDGLWGARPDPAHVLLKRGPEGEFARTPDEFVDLWRKGYR